MNDYDMHYSGEHVANPMPQTREYGGDLQAEYTPYIVKEEDEVIEDISTGSGSKSSSRRRTPAIMFAERVRTLR